MSEAVTVRSLFESMQKGLELEWLAGRRGGQRQFKREVTSRRAPSLLGHLNLIHPNKIQVIGETEMEYLSRLRKNSLEDAHEQMFSGNTLLLLIADSQDPSQAFLDAAEEHHIPVLRSPRPSDELINILRYFFTNRLAEKTTVHGVFMEVMGIGLLLTGDSNVGKSELALELITRGHRLVADDSPEFSRIAPDILSGTCPAVLQDFLEVRGLGVLNIRAMYGDNAIKSGKYLRLIINLKHQPEIRGEELDRLQGDIRSREILGLDVPEISLPVAPGRNLAVLVEAAVRNHLLRLNGYNAGVDLASKQQRLILQSTE